MREINAILKDLRNDSGLSIQQLSKETGINIFTLTGYDLGLLLPSSEHLNIFADYYKCSLNFILGIEGNPHIDTLEGNQLPEILREHGITQIAVRAGHKISDEEAESLVKFFESQKINLK